MQVIRDMPEAEYHARPELSASIAKRLIAPGGPARYKWEQEHGRKESKAFDLGHAAHTLVLGRGEPIAVIPEEALSANGGVGTKAAAAFIAAAREAGQTPLKPAEHQTVLDMASALARHLDAINLLALAEDIEVSAFAADPATGVEMRCRFDAIGPDVLIDYKTSVSADPARWARRVVDCGYHLQAAHYEHMARLCGITDAPMRFIVQEKEPPYLVSVIRLDEEAINLGAYRMDEAAAIWQRCHATGVWPGYGEGEHLIELPAWAYDELFSDEMEVA